MAAGVQRLAARAASVTARRAKATQAARLTLSDIPGPGGLPFLGAVGYFNRLGFPRIKDTLINLHEEFGPIVRFTLFGQEQVAVADAGMVEQIYRNEGTYPFRPSPPPFKEYFEKYTPKLPRTYVSMQGQEWKEDRTPANPPMMRPMEMKDWVVTFSHAAGDLCDILEARACASAQREVSVSLLLQEWAVESATRMLLRRRDMGILSGKDERGLRFISAMRGFFEGSAKLSASLPLFKLYETNDYLKTTGAFEDAFHIAEEWVKEAMHSGTFEEDNGLPQGVAQALLAKGMPTDRVASHSVTLIGGAGDTTSRAAAFTLLALAMNPAIQEELREEVLGRTAATGRAAEEFDHDDLQALPLVRATHKEQMRLWPIAFANQRILPDDIELGGYHIPAGSSFLISHAAMLMRRDYFGDDVDTFRPHRWLEEKRPAFAAAWFGVGPRACIGRRVAENELYTMVANVLSRYRVEPGTDAENIQAITKLILMPDRDVNLRFVPL